MSKADNLSTPEAPLDPFAFAGSGLAPQRLMIELWAEHEKIAARVAALPKDCSEAELAAIDPLIDRSLEIEDEIAGRVATDKSGLIAQLHLLAEHHQDFEWGQWGDDLVRKLIAGIAILQSTNS